MTAWDETEFDEAFGYATEALEESVFWEGIDPQLEELFDVVTHN